MIKRFVSIVLLLLLAPVIYAQQPPRANLLLNFYPYHSTVKDDYDFSMDLGINITDRLSYFGFVNLANVFTSGGIKFQISEQSIRWIPARNLPIDLVYQHVFRYGHDNDTIQLGTRWRVSSTELFKDMFRQLNLNYSVQFFVKRFDQRINDGWQISHGYLMSFPHISDRLYLTGFIDQNLDEKRANGTKFNPVVAEAQIGFRVFQKLYAVAEYRINEYRENNKTNLSVGFELQSSW